MKGNKVLISIIVALLGIILILSGTVVYMYYDSNNKNINNSSNTNNEVEKDKNTSKVKRLSDDDENVLKFKKVIGIADACFGNCSDINCISNYFASKKNVNLFDETPSFRNSLTYETYYFDLNDEIKNGVIYISEERLKDYYSELFGIDTYKQANFDYGIGLLTEYDEENKYYYYSNGFGGEAGPGTYFPTSTYAYAEKENDIINIYAYYYVLYEDIGRSEDSDDYNKYIVEYYSDLEHTNLIDKKSNDNLEKKYTKEQVIEKYKDKLGLHKYVFEKNKDGKYVFTKFETVK